MTVEGYFTFGAIITFAMLGLDKFYSVGLTFFSFFLVLPEYKVVGGGSLMDLPYNDVFAS